MSNQWNENLYGIAHFPHIEQIYIMELIKLVTPQGGWGIVFSWMDWLGELLF